MAGGPLLISLLFGLSAAALGWLGGRTLLRRRSELAIRRRLGLRRGLKLNRGHHPPAAVSARRCPLGMLLAPSSARELERVRYRLELAGLRRDDSIELYYCIRYLGALAVLVAGGAGWWLGAISLATVLLLALLPLYLPELWLRFAAIRREQQILRALPDFIDLCVICMSAGLGWLAAVRRVSDQLARSQPAICQEFSYLLDQVQTGMPRAEALRELQRRNPSREVGQLVQVLLQNERLGSAVSAALSDFSRRLYAEREQMLEEKAGKVAAKMALITFPFLLLPFMLLLSGEQMVKLLRALM